MTLCPFCEERQIVPPRRVLCGARECIAAYFREYRELRRGGPGVKESNRQRPQEVLRRLSRFDEATPGQIAEACEISRANAHQVLSRLVRAGLAVRLKPGLYAPKAGAP